MNDYPNRSDDTQRDHGPKNHPAQPLTQNPVRVTYSSPGQSAIRRARRPGFAMRNIQPLISRVAGPRDSAHLMYGRIHKPSSVHRKPRSLKTDAHRALDQRKYPAQPLSECPEGADDSSLGQSATLGLSRRSLWAKAEARRPRYNAQRCKPPFAKPRDSANLISGQFRKPTPVDGEHSFNPFCTHCDNEPLMARLRRGVRRQTKCHAAFERHTHLENQIVAGRATAFQSGSSRQVGTLQDLAAVRSAHEKFLSPKADAHWTHDPERGCVGAGGRQPQRVEKSGVLRLVSDTAALRPLPGAKRRTP